jgi:hypothetical protein
VLSAALDDPPGEDTAEAVASPIELPGGDPPTHPPTAGSRVATTKAAIERRGEALSSDNDLSVRLSSLTELS